ncbi:MAG: hypothetical protein GY845_09895, partial [Planctomycetes bacterium]|nr:hypothetical protein [Planctomycetota bacterium]
GIWSPRKLKTLYQMMAVELRVPISVLVCHILNSWAIENGQTMLQDDKQRQGFGEYLAKQRKADLERRKT